MSLEYFRFIRLDVTESIKRSLIRYECQREVSLDREILICSMPNGFDICSESKIQSHNYISSFKFSTII